MENINETEFCTLLIKALFDSFHCQSNMRNEVQLLQDSDIYSNDQLLSMNQSSTFISQETNMNYIHQSATSTHDTSNLVVPQPINCVSSQYLNFMRLVALFPQLNQATIHGVLGLCDNNLGQAIDNILYSEQYRTYLEAKSQGFPATHPSVWFPWLTHQSLFSKPQDTNYDLYQSYVQSQVNSENVNETRNYPYNCNFQTNITTSPSDGSSTSRSYDNVNLLNNMDVSSNMSVQEQEDATRNQPTYISDINIFSDININKSFSLSLNGKSLIPYFTSLPIFNTVFKPAPVYVTNSVKVPVVSSKENHSEVSLPYVYGYLSQDGCTRDNLVPTPKNSKLLWQFEPVKSEHQEVLTTYVQPVIRIHQLSVTTFRVAIGVVARVLLPTVVGVYWAVVRNRSLLLDYLRRYLLPPALIAHLANTISRSLSSVQVLRGNSWKTVTEIVVEAPKRLTRSASRQKSIVQQEEERCQSIVREIPEKCVTCTVLAEPEDGEIMADVIFVHGLHGSLYNTWRQGDWDPVKKRVVPPTNQMLRRCVSLPATNSTNGIRACNIHFNERNSISGDDSSFQYNEIDLGMKTNNSVIYNNNNNNNNNTCSDNINNICEFCDISNTGNLVYCSGNNDVGSMVYNDRSNNNMYESGGKKYANYSKCWPRDWLPQDCPGVRVIALNYTTDPYLWRPVWIKKRNRSSMAERAREMLEHLQRIGVGQNPIVWVAHSKGGLFVKQMIVDAWESQYKPDHIENNISNVASSNLSTICSMTRGIMFYSVPHRGSSLADMNLPLLRQSVELTEIQKDCPSILDLHNKFIAICKSGRFEPEIFSFIETSLTFMSVLYLRIVATESADPGVGETCGVPLDHRDICKPSSRECLLYQELACLINRVVERSSYLTTSDIKNVCPKFY